MDKQRFEIVNQKHRKQKNVKLPQKATDKSVGYDFFLPGEVKIYPGEKSIICTDVKVNLDADELLLILPRSSIGIKKNIMLANTVGIIDPDYYGNIDNDGNIIICLFNYGAESIVLQKGDRFAQGIVVKTVYDSLNHNSSKRAGGIGSTGV